MSFQLPTAILCLSEFLPDEATQQRQIVQSFISDMEKALGVTSQPISIQDAWRDAPPPEAKGQTLTRYLNAEVRRPNPREDL